MGQRMPNVFLEGNYHIRVLSLPFIVTYVRSDKNWSIAPEFWLKRHNSDLDSFLQIRCRLLVFHCLLSYGRNIARLSPHSSYLTNVQMTFMLDFKCIQLVLTVLFTRLYFHCIIISRSNFYSDRFFSKTPALGNRLSLKHLPEHNNRNLFK